MTTRRYFRCRTPRTTTQLRTASPHLRLRKRRIHQILTLAFKVGSPRLRRVAVMRQVTLPRFRQTNPRRRVGNRRLVERLFPPLVLDLVQAHQFAAPLPQRPLPTLPPQLPAP